MRGPGLNRACAPAVCFRQQARSGDLAAVRGIVESTGFFSSAEIDIAVELIEDRLSQGSSSDYRFLFVEAGDSTIGYSCYGPIAGTQGSFDLYWIAVHNQHRGRGIGGALMRETERLIVQEGGRRVYVETSSRAQYEPTRAFYSTCGYQAEATLKDFYGPGDGKIIFVRAL